MKGLKGFGVENTESWQSHTTVIAHTQPSLSTLPVSPWLMLLRHPVVEFAEGCECGAAVGMVCVRALSLLIPEEVSAYEAMKLRLLDGGYCAVSYMAFLLGHREMDEAMADVRVAQFLRSYYAEVRASWRSVGWRVPTSAVASADLATSAASLMAYVSTGCMRTGTVLSSAMFHLLIRLQI
jgi:hypothetical protein